MEIIEVIEKKLIKANIDEKNVCSDWIFDCLLIDGDGVIEIPSDKGNSYLGIIGTSAVNVQWATDDNKVTFKFLHTLFNEPREEDKDRVYKFFFTDFKGDDDNNLRVSVTQVDSDTITASFFWEVKE